MPKLLQSIVTVIEVFYQYATQDEECDMLNRAELKEFLENEFHQIMKVRTPYQDWKQLQFPSPPFLPFVTYVKHLEDSPYLVTENRAW